MSGPLDGDHTPGITPPLGADTTKAMKDAYNELNRMYVVNRLSDLLDIRAEPNGNPEYKNLVSTTFLAMGSPIPKDMTGMEALVGITTPDTVAVSGINPYHSDAQGILLFVRDWTDV